jgi:recombination protein RecT
MPKQNEQKEQKNLPVAVDMNAALDKPREIEALLLAREELPALLEDAGVTPQRFIATTIHALAESPKAVREAPRGELLLAILKAARMGLEPTGAYGGGYLIKMRGEPVDFWTDWRGLIKMAMRSGQLRKADPFIVFENDEFDYLLGDEQYIHHRPFIGTSEERGEPRFAYAILELSNGAKVREVMSWDEVMAIMARAPAKERGPWGSDPLEMGRKTVLRRAFKRVPAVVTPQLAYALQHEDAEWERERDPGSGATVARANEGRRGAILARLRGTSSNGQETGEPPSEADSAETVEESEEELLAQAKQPMDSEEGLPE